MIEPTKTTYTVKLPFPDGSELIAQHLTKEQAEWLNAKLTAPTPEHTESVLKASDWELAATNQYMHRKYGIVLYKRLHRRSGWWLKPSMRESLSKTWWLCGAQAEDFDTELTDLIVAQHFACSLMRELGRGD